MKTIIALLLIFALVQSSRVSSKNHRQQQLSPDDRQMYQDELNKIVDQGNDIQNVIYNWKGTLQFVDDQFHAYDGDSTGTLNDFEAYDFFFSLSTEYRFLENFGPIDFQSLLWQFDRDGDNELNLDEIHDLLRQGIVWLNYQLGSERGVYEYILNGIPVDTSVMDAESAYRELERIYEMMQYGDEIIWTQMEILTNPDTYQQIINEAFYNSDQDYNGVIDDEERWNLVNEVCALSRIEHHCSDWDFDMLFNEVNQGEEEMTKEEYEAFIGAFLFKSLTRNIFELAQEQAPFWQDAQTLEDFIWEQNYGQYYSDDDDDDSGYQVSNWDDYNYGWNEGYNQALQDNGMGYVLMQKSSTQFFQKQADFKEKLSKLFVHKDTKVVQPAKTGKKHSKLTKNSKNLRK